LESGCEEERPDESDCDIVWIKKFEGMNEWICRKNLREFLYDVIDMIN